MPTFEERFGLRQDTLAGKIPKRVFVAGSFTLEAACSYAGVDLKEAHFSPELTEKAYEAVCKDFYADALPVMNLRFPLIYQLLGAKNWILGSNGVMQHPEIETLLPEEYDEYIEKPYDVIVEKLLPRVCANLDTDRFNAGLILAKAYAEYKKTQMIEFGTYMKLSQKYGLAPGFITGELIEAPFDFLADQLRGFKQINMDLRRRADKVKAACEATLPLMMRRAVTREIPPGKINFIPLHLAPYLKMSDFDKYYWPTFEELVVEQDKLGIASNIFAEEDWTRFADHLSRLPESTIIMFEKGDYKVLKETAGKNHVITGFYDPTITLTKTKEECIDEAKRLLDVCMPGGRFFFSFDKGVMDIKSVDVPKLQAVLEWVGANANY